MTRTILSSSPTAPQDAQSSSLLREYMEWFISEECADDEDWNRDIENALDCLYEQRVDLTQVGNLGIDWYQSIGIKFGIASRLKAKVKAFLRQRRRTEEQARTLPSQHSRPGTAGSTQISMQYRTRQPLPEC